MASYPSLHEIRAKADEFWNLWEELLGAAPKLRQAIGQHSPTCLGWKVEGDNAPLEAALPLFELGDSLYLGPVNQERSILTIRKPQAVALDTLTEIKLLQRRPSRPTDTLGADSLDLLVPHGLTPLSELTAALAGTEAVCEAESNPIHHWISIKYKDHEFKLTDRPVWSVCLAQAETVL